MGRTVPRITHVATARYISDEDDPSASGREGELLVLDSGHDQR